MRSLAAISHTGIRVTNLSFDGIHNKLFTRSCRHFEHLQLDRLSQDCWHWWTNILMFVGPRLAHTVEQFSLERCCIMVICLSSHHLHSGYIGPLLCTLYTCLTKIISTIFFSGKLHTRFHNRFYLNTLSCSLRTFGNIFWDLGDVFETVCSHCLPFLFVISAQISSVSQSINRAIMTRSIKVTYLVLTL